VVKNILIAFLSYKLILFVFLSMAFFAENLQAQTQNSGSDNVQKQETNIKKQEKTKASLIQYKKTGNTEVDKQNYENEKADWLLKNGKKENANTVPKTKKVEYSEVNGSKPHFVLKLNPSHQHQYNEYQKALNSYTRIESYRLVHKRRTISLSGNIGTIELFSAKEMLDKYGRRIRPQNIQEGAPVKEIELLLGENGLIKEQLIK
jgi:hypothetical protein